MERQLTRSEIEKEVDDDLAKSDKHLLIDIHQEILRTDRRIEENMIHALKRFSSLMTRSTIASRDAANESNKLQQKIANLTLGIWIFSIILIIITLLSAIPFIENIFNVPKTMPNISESYKKTNP